MGAERLSGELIRHRGRRTFRWEGAAAWLRAVRRDVERAAGTLPAARLREGPGDAADERCVPWLEARLGPAPTDAVLATLAARFRTRYAHVEAYHAGRPADAGLFPREGIVPLDGPRLREAAARLFTGPGEGRVPAAALDAVLARPDWPGGYDRAWLALDRRHLLECDTFYLQYGSHSLFSLAVRLQRETGTDLKPRLRAAGVPALAACRTPTSRLDDGTLRGLCALGVREAFRAEPPGETPRRVRFDFPAGLRIPPSAVRRQWHPDRVADHLYPGEE